ncbi:hypothetical protein SteCoe_6788 [Stentor coeruleus]|uniref:Dynamin-type G domain-containing protein n=1 Tax=Stentor coeruleus TaxID=5963 RepID=A0A1R2CP79_9CILI|nr:hypothetical protein SteCoe_6788 [Stentor coeruleus]
MDSLERLIPTINKLQDVISLINQPHLLSLPQIVVVGPQSSGKSSVLESLVGKDFLPRGAGIVTRRPLILQLVHTQDKDEWGEFLHKPDTKFKDFKLILGEIENATRQIAGTKAGISSDPINLKIYSPKVLDITLVDLPGLTKVAVGDQPQDIEFQIKDMIMEFITRPEAIILAVSNANTDLANSDSLKLAREVDPEGHRTLGILTKIDLMDKGTDARDMLMGNIYPLKLGYVGVVCRSQADINNRKPIEKHLNDEKTFFRNHPAYSTYSDRLGMSYLATRLNTLLIKHIKDTLPVLKENINKMLKSCREELSTYGEGLDGDSGKMFALILQVIESYSRQFRESIEVTMENFMEMSIGAKIKDILFKQFKETIEGIDMFRHLSDELIITAIKNATGIRSSLFIPEQAFEMLMKKLITRLKEPSIACLYQVLNELKQLEQVIKVKEFDVYPNLATEIAQIIDDMLNRFGKPAQHMIENIIKIETTYINIEHPDFIGGAEAIKKINEEGAPIHEVSHFVLDKDTAPLSGFMSPKKVPEVEDEKNKEFRDLEIIKMLISSYYKIVKKNIEDAVPKAIMGFLVNKAKFKIQTELVSTIYKEDKIYELLTEPGDIPERRMKCKELLRSLERANTIINEVRYFT